MSMASYEPDRDYGDETEYENRPFQSSGLCERCGMNAAVPNDDFCQDCVGEIEAVVQEFEDVEDAA